MLNLIRGKAKYIESKDSSDPSLTRNYIIYVYFIFVHYKQTRVSGVMSNAPFMLNVDCDMYANNPQVVLHAMCYFFGAKDEKDCAFVQFPQFFYDGLKGDPYGNQLKVLHEVNSNYL